MDVFEVLQKVDTTRRRLEKKNGIATPRSREVSSRYRSPTPTPTPTPINSRRCQSPNLTRNNNNNNNNNVSSALPSSAPKRAVSAERRRPSSPRPWTPVSDTSAESQLSARKMTGSSSSGSRLAEVLWPSTMRSLSVSFQSDSISIPVVKKEKPVTHTHTHASSDRTLKPTSNVDTAASPRKPTPETKRNPFKAKNSSRQSENSRPSVDASQSKLIDQHRWPSRAAAGGARLSSNFMTASVDLTDTSRRIPRRLSAEGNPRPLCKTTSSDASEFDDQIGALALRMKSVDDSLLRMSATHKAASTAPASSLRSGPVPGSPSRVSISRALPSPSKTRPSTPTQSRGTSPSRIRPSSPTRQSSSTTSVLSFIADIKKGKKNNQLEVVHQLRLLYNRHLQWRFANARAQAALYIQKFTAEVATFHLLVIQ